MENHPKHSSVITIVILSILVVALLGGFGYGYYLFTQLQTTNTDLQTSLTTTQNKLAVSEQQKNDLLSALNEAAQQNQSFAQQLNTVTQTANKLQWLSTLDPQLLQKYSKVYFLNENYVPRELSPIDTKFLFDPKKSLEIHDRVLPFLQQMLQAAALDNIAIQVQSAYRSFDYQKNLKSNYKVTYGTGANAFSAEQGYSEHQLGTALDLTTPKVGGALTGFEKTTAYTWMQNNAYKYGFILSYPQHNAYYIFEPWHWRFVGIELATRLHNENKNFYDLDQRDIDTYLGNMFSPTGAPTI